MHVCILSLSLSLSHVQCCEEKNTDIHKSDLYIHLPALPMTGGKLEKQTVERLLHVPG
jgi:hypothetical protein